MIFITGDTHGLIDFAKLKTFADQHKELTKNDYVIIAGDCGIVFNKETLEQKANIYSSLPFTILFVDGNHENFDLLNAYKVKYWHGGKVHFIKKDIIHLMRGQVFEIENKTFFTFGGGTSIDKQLRIENVSWWKEEIPNYLEIDEAIDNLKKHNNEVDYIITHSIDEKALYYPIFKTIGNPIHAYIDNQILSFFEDNINYKHWYFGHYHIDGPVNKKKTALYQEIKRII